MLEILLKSAVTFLCTVVVHIIIWRIYRPVEYRAWVPTLLGIFAVGGALIAAALVAGPRWTVGREIADPLTEWVAISLLQASVAVVYTFGYTLLLVGSPSLVILEKLAGAPKGLGVHEVGLPMSTDDLVGLRMDNLVNSGFVTADPKARQLTPKGSRLTHAMLAYRHLIGLRDGEGG